MNKTIRMNKPHSPLSDSDRSVSDSRLMILKMNKVPAPKYLTKTLIKIYADESLMAIIAIGVVSCPLLLLLLLMFSSFR